MITGREIAIRLGWKTGMLFDISDPVGTIQMIVSILVLVELIQFLDTDDMGAHIQKRVAFYSGIFGKVWGFLKLAGSGFQILYGWIFKRKKKGDQSGGLVKETSEVYQMEEPEEEDPFEGEGAIEG